MYRRKDRRDLGIGLLFPKPNKMFLTEPDQCERTLLQANHTRDVLARSLYCRALSAVLKRANSCKRATPSSASGGGATDNSSNDSHGTRACTHAAHRPFLFHHLLRALLYSAICSRLPPPNTTVWLNPAARYSKAVFRLVDLCQDLTRLSGFCRDDVGSERWGGVSGGRRRGRREGPEPGRLHRTARHVRLRERAGEPVGAAVHEPRLGDAAALLHAPRIPHATGRVRRGAHPQRRARRLPRQRRTHTTRLFAGTHTLSTLSNSHCPPVMCFDSTTMLSRISICCVWPKRAACLILLLRCSTRGS